MSLILIKTHAGSPTDLSVIREATGAIAFNYLAALESVFPPSGLNAFANLRPSEKEASLAALANLVTGIRLFNKQIEKGGHAIENCKLFTDYQYRRYAGMSLRTCQKPCIRKRKKQKA